jgi:hypothetical protein
VRDSTGATLAPVESFRSLLSRRPDTDLSFWNLWYLGRIPWDRETVMPAALLDSALVHLVFDGQASVDPPGGVADQPSRGRSRPGQ